MTSKPGPDAPLAMTFERSYEASVADLWELWTTKDGFRVVVGTARASASTCKKSSRAWAGRSSTR